MSREKKPYRRDNLICVATVYGQLQGQVLKSKLETAEIPVMLQYESYGLVLGLTVDGMGQVRVMVPEELADEACAVLAMGPDGDEFGAEGSEVEGTGAEGPDYCSPADAPEQGAPGEGEPGAEP